MAREEFLIYFRPLETEQGTAPGYYEIANSRADAAAAVRYGGRDVTESPEDWQEFERQNRADNLNYLF